MTRCRVSRKPTRRHKVAGYVATPQTRPAVLDVMERPALPKVFPADAAELPVALIDLLADVARDLQSLALSETCRH